jgi:hypothetical protein
MADRIGQRRTENIANDRTELMEWNEAKKKFKL